MVGYRLERHFLASIVRFYSLRGKTKKGKTVMPFPFLVDFD
jgi:hypothetical protein